MANIFLENGYKVLGTSTTGKADIRHKNLKVFKLNLNNETSIKKCTRMILKDSKKIDVLINNAAVLLDLNELVLNVDKLRKTIEVNLLGTTSFTEKLLQKISKKGCILNISSNSGSIANVSHSRSPAYKISKAGLNMYTRSLAMRLGKDITVVSINPGWMNTDMGKELTTDAPTYQPEESAEWIYKLVENHPVSGQFYKKDGINEW